MTDHEWDELATYHAERARGLVHTPEWEEKMRREKERFDWHMANRMGVATGPPPPPDPKVILPPQIWIEGEIPPFPWRQILAWAGWILAVVALGYLFMRAGQM